ncbi:MAG: phage terminase large subunit [Chthonomonas sp.]|nr:phage terminase large subunit [Chthonomonas sp.]
MKSPYLSWLEKNKRADFSYQGRHFRAIALLIDRVLTGELLRVRIHMPPRHGKTESVTKALPIWFLQNRPGCRILITGHNMRFARKLSRAIRNRAEELGIELASDKFSSDEWYTADGSMVMAAGVGNVPTGEGFDLIIADDPIRDRKQADSLNFRDDLWDWWTEGLMTRLQPKGIMVGIWTLWHEDDPAGRMDDLAKSDDKADQWTVLKLPAIAVEGDALGRKVGQPLWPEMWPLERLENRRASMMRKDGSRAWEALYQQNPKPLEGRLFKVSMIKVLDLEDIPEGEGNDVRHWDIAATADGGDYTAGVRLRYAGGKYIVVDVVSGQWGPEDLVKVMKETTARDGLGVLVSLSQDPGAAGKILLNFLVKELRGYAVAWEKESGSKEFRAMPCASQVNIGNFAIARAKWNMLFFDRLRSFPLGHDDLVDALSNAFTRVNERAEDAGILYPDDPD